MWFFYVVFLTGNRATAPFRKEAVIFSSRGAEVFQKLVHKIAG